MSQTCRKGLAHTKQTKAPLGLGLSSHQVCDQNDIYLLVLSAEKGFEVGSKRVARSRESKRFERRITKGTKYFDEVCKSFMNELLWGLNDWFGSRGMDGGSGGQRP